MRRLIVPIALVLALTTGAWIGQAVTFFSEPLAFEEDTLGDENTVRHFYEAVQSFLATGDAIAVRDAVAENFVDHAVLSGTESTQEGLVRYLSVLRHMFPDLRIEPSEIVVQHDRIVALVDVTWATAAPFLGMAPAGVAPWGRLDMFDVTAGRIVAHWGDVSGRGSFEPIASGLFSTKSKHVYAAELTRRVYEPGASDGDLPASGPAALLVESGRVVVDIDGPVLATVIRSSSGTGRDRGQEHRVERSDVVTLGPGDALTVAEPAQIETRNDAGTPARVLVFSLGLPKSYSPGDAQSSAAPPGLDLRSLAGGQDTESTVDLYSVAIGRAVLSRGVGLASHIVNGQELVFVESGSLAVTVGGGPAWTRQPDQTATAVDGAATLQTGTGLSIPAGTTVTYRNDGSEAMSLLIVTITSVAAAPLTVPDATISR